MRLQTVVLLALVAAAAAWPKISCKNFVCENGWSTKSVPPPENIACLGGVCTQRTCCNPPTCASYIAPGCVQKDNALAIQCRGQTLEGCNRELCCKAGLTPTDAPTQFVPSCARNVIYWTNFLNGDRVNSLDVTVDDSGIAPIPGSEQLVARTGGADGLLVNPQNSRQLFVGGQQPRLFVVDTTNPDPATNWWRQTANQSIFNVVAASQDTVLGFTLDGARTISRHRIVGGTLPNNVRGELVTLSGYDINVTAVIAVPGGRYLYTSSSNGGEVSGVGWITFDAAPATTAVTAAPHLYVRAHSGLYEPYSNTLLFWGERTVSQYTVAGVNIGTVDVGALIGTGGQAGFRHLDNGVADGNGRVLLAANNGMLLWFDLRATMQISSALSNSFRVTPADGLDAVTAPVCIY